MAHANRSVDAIWRDGPDAFAFLIEQGFVGPAGTDESISYQRDALTVEIGYWRRHHDVDPSFLINIWEVGYRR